MKTSGNTVLITGGTSGIGLELARQLLALDNTVLITGRSQPRLDAARALLPKVHTFVSDVADPRAIAALSAAVTARFPALNVLVNNAGVARKINLNDASGGLEDLGREIATNLVGPVQMVKQFLPQLKAQPAAAIVNVSSGLAFLPLPLTPIYCATKAALHSYTQSLRVQLKSTRVKVFELAPPATGGTALNSSDFTADEIDPRMLMDLGKMVRAAIAGLRKDQPEILPGMSPVLRLLARLVPRYTFMSKAAETMALERKAIPALSAPPSVDNQ